MRKLFVRSSTGIRYAYSRGGSGSGPPLLFLSHFRATIDMWDPALVERLAAGREVVLIDNRGIGLTDGAAPHTVEEMAHGVLDFVDTLGLARVDLLGFSLGGYVAQQVARTRPELVRRLVLAGTAPRGSGEDLALSGRVHTITRKSAIGPKDLIHLFFPGTPEGRDAGVAFIRRLGRPREDPDTGVEEISWRAQLDAAKTWGADLPDNSEKPLPHPVLVAHGEQDVMISAAKGRLLAARLPNATLKVFPHAGHGFLFQEHEDFAADVLAFLSAEETGAAVESREHGAGSAAGEPARCPFVLDVTGADQHAENARLRAAGRAVPVRLPGDVEAWAVPHHDDLRRVLTDPRVAKGIEHWGAMNRGEVPDGWPLIGFVSTESVINSHGSAHRRLRGLVDQALTPARVEKMRPGVEKRSRRRCPSIPFSP
ncbi:alpha/beta fold hydrolase [Streptomyces sp. NPDC026672]|uniref:alpha/beta fold hydrolase n=1 Tax=unclassified Streptomyces TaxID=2593676 RepID=UPI0033CDB451